MKAFNSKQDIVKAIKDYFFHEWLCSRNPKPNGFDNYFASGGRQELSGQITAYVGRLEQENQRLRDVLTKIAKRQYTETGFRKSKYDGLATKHWTNR